MFVVQPGPDALLPQAMRPDWAAPARVRALMSTRLGGVSAAPFDSLNLRHPALGGTGLDEADAVAENQHRFAQALGARPVWLNQVHGTAVVRLTGASEAATGQTLPVADASFTTESGLACTVMVADCLPVLLCDQQGRVVGAAHAGWRGLACGVLEATVEAMCAAAGVAPATLIAWLGPCIGPDAFEVGPDVLVGFGLSPETQDGPHFRYVPRADGSPRWRADLPGLARQRLQAVGLYASAIHGGQWCTVSEPARFFSFRRQAVTGRLAGAVALVDD